MIGGALAVVLHSQSLLLYVVVSISFLVYALIPGIAFKLGSWGTDRRGAAPQPKTRHQP